MGIAGFQKWLVATFPDAVKMQGDRFGEVYDHVAFDLNQIFHQAARRASTRQSLARVVFRELDAILKSCIPRKSVFLAFDGPGPLAKLVTQRRRRTKTRVEHFKGLRRRKGRKGITSLTVRAIDRLELTPGVETLYFLRDAIEYWACTRLQNDRKYANVKVHISGPDTPGEGELKVIDFCRLTVSSKNESIVVIGGDADIVLQGLATLSIRDFFVYLRHFGSHGRKRINYVLSVWELTRLFEKMFPGDSFGVRLDFILLSVMNGNDYVPKARGVNLSRIWRRYMNLKSNASIRTSPFTGQFLIDAEARTFNWPFLYKLIDKVGPPVPSLSDRLSGKGTVSAGSEDSGSSEPGEEIVYTGDEEGIPMNDMEQFSADPSLSQDDNEDLVGEANDLIGVEDDCDELIDDDFEHFQTIMNLTVEPQKLCDVERWLRTLLWTLHSYVDGFCADYSFQYGPMYGPSCDMITQFIDEHNGDPFAVVSPISQAKPLKPHETALAMLPSHGFRLLPAPLRVLMKDPIISKHMFPGQDHVDVSELVREVARVPSAAYSADELKLTVHGKPISLRVSTDPGSGGGLPKVTRPGPRFEELRRHPSIHRELCLVTESPPCYSWVHVMPKDLLLANYKKVGGNHLKRGMNSNQ